MAPTTFNAMRTEAERLVADALDQLRSDWKDGHGPNADQAEALRRAQEHLRAAKGALVDAARMAG